MVSQADYHSAVMPRTFDVYDHVDDWHYMGLHDWIKAEKHGITKVVDQACREIRHGRLSRSEAITITKKVCSASSKYGSLLLEWLNMSESTFGFIVDRIANKNSVRDIISARGSLNSFLYPGNDMPIDYNANETKQKPILGLSPSSTLSRGLGNRHICIGKGYP